MFNLKIMAQQLKLSSRGKKTLAQKKIQHTVREVREIAKKTLIEKMKDSYGLELTIDDKETDIHPEPKSESQQWRKLPKNTKLVFWPAEDVPLQIKYKDTLQKLRLQDQEPTTPSDQIANGATSIDPLEAEANDVESEESSDTWQDIEDMLIRQIEDLKSIRKDIHSVNKTMDLILSHDPMDMN